MTARRSTPMVPAAQRSVPQGVERRAIRKAMEAAAGCRAHGDRAGPVRRGRPGGRGVRAADQKPPTALPAVQPALSRLRPGRGPAPLARAGPWRGAGVPGGRRATGGLSRPRGGGRRGAVGAAWGRVHPSVRGHRGVAGGPHLPVGGRRVAAHRLAHGRPGLRPGRRRPGHAHRPVRWAAADRGGRDRLQEGPPLPHRRGRSRHRPAGVGRARPRRGHPGALLRRPRRGSRPQAHPPQRGCGELDLQRGGAPLPAGGAVPGPLPRRGSGPPTRWMGSAARSGTPPARAGMPWRPRS